MARANLNKTKFFLTSTTTLCEFSTVWADWADWADLGSTETVLQTDSNFPSKGQFFTSIFN
jgi:hypothetical protein